MTNKVNENEVFRRSYHLHVKTPPFLPWWPVSHQPCMLTLNWQLHKPSKITPSLWLQLPPQLQQRPQLDTQSVQNNTQTDIVIGPLEPIWWTREIQSRNPVKGENKDSFLATQWRQKFWRRRGRGDEILSLKGRDDVFLSSLVIYYWGNVPSFLIF